MYYVLFHSQINVESEETRYRTYRCQLVMKNEAKTTRIQQTNPIGSVEQRQTQLCKLKHFARDPLWLVGTFVRLGNISPKVAKYIESE